MARPTELSFNEILKFMLVHNGKVTNHALVKHFRQFLTDPATRDEARHTFKKHVNTLATIKNQSGEKWLILKRKYMPHNSNDAAVKKSAESGVNVNQNENSFVDLVIPEPPQYTLPSAVGEEIQDVNETIDDVKERNSCDDTVESEAKQSPVMMDNEEPQPKLYPRKKSSSSTASYEKPSTSSSTGSVNEKSYDNIADSSQDIADMSNASSLAEVDQTVSVKERKQMFNKMASEMDVLKPQQIGKRSKGIDEEDRASVVSKSDVEPLDASQKKWILSASRGDHPTLSNMLSENPRLVKTKDPFTYTALHWASKRGEEHLVKLLANNGRKMVNERSGYTPLHIAMQFHHRHIYKLLVEVYDGNPNIRDWSGRMPNHYLVNSEIPLPTESYRKALLKAEKKNLEKEGFLRMGSFNVRVKKTTEAFSNFLGVSATRASSYFPTKSSRSDIPTHHEESDQVHKTWGSADNIVLSDNQLMPPPSSVKIHKRSAAGRSGVVTQSRSTPSTPDQSRAHLGSGEGGDSDSDTAAGFHDAWRTQRKSNLS